MTIKNTEALQKLANIVRSKPAAKVNMGAWAEKVTLGRKSECGTTACACGWAGLSPWFQKRGFKTVFENTYRGHYSARIQLNTPNIQQHSAKFEDIAKFFGIPTQHAHYLFDPWYYNEEDGPEAKKELLKRVDLTLKGHGALRRYVTKFMRDNQLSYNA